MPKQTLSINARVGAQRRANFMSLTMKPQSAEELEKLKNAEKAKMMAEEAKMKAEKRAEKKVHKKIKNQHRKII